MPFEFQADAEVRRVKLKSSVMVNNADAYIECALEGLGLIQPPRASVADHLAAGRLVEVLPDCRPPTKPASILYPHRRHVRPPVRAFSSWIEEVILNPQ